MRPCFLAALFNFQIFPAPQFQRIINPIQPSHPDELRAPGRVIEVMRDGAYRVELPNGHRAVGQARETTFALGDAVTIAFHPFDLARGWIVENSLRSSCMTKTP